MRQKNKWDVFRWNGLHRNASEYDFLADGCKLIERGHVLITP